eukprot:scaffold78169_cov50-Cyclotella_meneghiniana.AAC.2
MLSTTCAWWYEGVALAMEAVKSGWLLRKYSHRDDSGGSSWLCGPNLTVRMHNRGHSRGR